MSDDKCPNCGGELISRVSFVDYCLDCETTIDASYWRTRAEAAEAQVAALQAALDAAINMNIEKNAEVVRLTAALATANEDAARLAERPGYTVDGAYELFCSYCGLQTYRHAVNCPITLHRARVGGGE